MLKYPKGKKESKDLADLTVRVQKVFTYKKHCLLQQKSLKKTVRTNRDDDM